MKVPGISIMKIPGMNISGMKIGTKLGLGFGFILLLVVILSTFVVAKLSGMSKDTARIDADLANKARVSTINTLAKDNALSSMEMLLSSDSGLHARIIAQIDERKKFITENMDSMGRDLAGFAQDEKLLAEVKKSRAVYVSGLEKVISLVKTGKREDASYVAGEEMIPMLVPLLKAVKNLDDHQAAKLDASTTQIKQTASSIRNMSIMIAVIVVLLGVMVAIMIVRGLMKQLGGEPDYAADAVGKISAGDLSAELALNPGDNSSLLYSLKTMQDSLRSIVAEIQGIVQAAVQGDFSKKMDMTGKAGYTKTLSELLNQLSTTVDDAFKDTIRVANALAEGDLSQKITKDYSGAYNQVKASVNTTADSLTKIVGEIQNIVEDAAIRGSFSTKMDLNGKQGYTKTLSELLNQLSNVTETGIADVVRVASALAKGDLTQTISKDYPGGFGEMKTGINSTEENLKMLMGEIKDATDTINTAAKEIAAGNNDLSQRTEEQASSLEETASSMEELTSTVKQNAENARQANQLAIGASDVASKGGAVVSQVVTTMNSINESSRKIVDIISVIDGIAFQTNILALNAAVEAARAGEQGRGFAVVAAEVRNLAQRSAAAAKEIKTLIGDSVDKVEGGSKLVAQAGQTMEEIVTSIKRVTDIMSEITAASDEQSAGIEQVNLAITQMDEVTQQNAALVEQAAAAAEALEEQAQNLSVSVGQFKMDGSGSPGSAAAVRRAPAAVSHATPAGHAATARRPVKAGHPATGKPAHPAVIKAKGGDGHAKAKPQIQGEDGEWAEF